MPKLHSKSRFQGSWFCDPKYSLGQSPTRLNLLLNRDRNKRFGIANCESFVFPEAKTTLQLFHEP